MHSVLTQRAHAPKRLQLVEVRPHSLTKKILSQDHRVPFSHSLQNASASKVRQSLFLSFST